MLETSPASHGLLFASFLYRSDLFTEKNLVDFWEQNFGNSFLWAPEFNPLNNYYVREMGAPLKRFFVLTSQKYPRDLLLSAKLDSLKWEKQWATENKRMINVDLGFLSLENFQLATTKNYSHRIYLGKNIFSDLTYYFHQGQFQTLAWTYPDFVDPKKIEFLTWGRSFLLQSFFK